MGKRWIPLEANPDVLTRFAGKLGLDTKKLQFCDVYGLDEVKIPRWKSSAQAVSVLSAVCSLAGIPTLFNLNFKACNLWSIL